MTQDEIIDDLIELMNRHIETCSSEGVDWEHTIKPLVSKYNLKLEGNANTYSIDYKVTK